jgi:hypothetical protein
MSAQTPADRTDDWNDDRDGDVASASDSENASQEETIGAPPPHSPIVELYAQGCRGANWFYFVAALSIVNTAMLLGGANRHFVIGMAVTQIVDMFGIGIVQEAPQHKQAVYAVVICINLLIALFVAGFAWLAKRRVTGVFVIGMLLYLFDGLLFVLFQDWLSAAFHAYALFAMMSGWSAFRKLDASMASDRSGGDRSASDEPSASQ